MQDIKGTKLLLSYEVNQDRQQEYYQFVMGRYLPALQSMGFQMSEAWHTAYGEAPSRLVGLVSAEDQAMQDLLASDLWLDLNEELAQFVTDFEYKFIPYRGGFQL
jgi:hypothetical protein